MLPHLDEVKVLSVAYFRATPSFGNADAAAYALGVKIRQKTAMNESVFRKRFNSQTKLKGTRFLLNPCSRFGVSVRT